MEDNLRSIYDKLVSSGSTGTYDEFVSFFNENDQNKKSVYDKLMTLGSKGTYDEFLAYAGAGQQPASRVDVSDVETVQQPQAPAMESPENGTEQTGIPTVTMEQLEQQPTGAPAPGSDGHFLGNISVGADGKPKPMEDNPLRNPVAKPAKEMPVEEQQPPQYNELVGREIYTPPTELSYQGFQEALQKQKELDDEFAQIRSQHASYNPRTGDKTPIDPEKYLLSVGEERQNIERYIYNFLTSEEGQGLMDRYQEAIDGERQTIEQQGGGGYTRAGQLLTLGMSGGAWSNTTTPIIANDYMINQQQKYAGEGTDYVAAKRKLNNAEKQLRMVRERLNGDYNAFWRGIRATDIEGAFSSIELIDNIDELILAKKVRNNQELTPSQESLLRAATLQSLVDEQYAQSNTTWERVGKETFPQLVTTAEFLAGSYFTGSMGVAENVSKNMAKKYTTRMAEKAVQSETKRLFARGVQEGTGYLAGAAVQTFANPISYLSMMSDAIEKNTGSVYFDENDGQIHYYDNGKDIALSLWQAAAGAYVENFTEFSGAGITKVGNVGMGRLYKAVPKLEGAVNTVDGFLDKVKFSKLTGLKVDAMDDYLRHAGFNGTLGEFSEEVLGNVIRPFMYVETKKGESYGDQLGRGMKNLIDSDQNLETFLSCAVTSAILGTSSTIRSTAAQGLDHAAQKREVEQNIKKLEALMPKINGFNLDEYKDYIGNHDIQEISQYIKEQAKANNWTEQECGMVAMHFLQTVSQQAIIDEESKQIQETIDELREQAKDMVNRWDGSHIYNVSFKDADGNMQNGTVVNGRVHYTQNDEGYQFNPYLSSAMLAIRLSDGSIKQVSSRNVMSLQNVATIDEQLQDQEQTVGDLLRRQFEQDGLMPTVEGVFGGQFEAGVTQLMDGRYTYLGRDDGGNYNFQDANAGKNENGVINISEESLIAWGLRMQLSSPEYQSSATPEQVQQTIDMADFMDAMDRIKQSANEDDATQAWKSVSTNIALLLKWDGSGGFDVDNDDPNMAAAYLYAESMGNSDAARESISKTLQNIAGQLSQMSADQGGASISENIAGQEAMSEEAVRLSKQAEYLQGLLPILDQMDARVAELRENDRVEAEREAAAMPVSQMEVGQEFPVMYDGQQAVAVVVGKDADGRNVLTIRDQEGNDLESGIDDWTDEQWERFKLRPEEVAMPSQQTEQQETAEIEQQPTEIEQNAPEIEQELHQNEQDNEPKLHENEQQEEVSVSPAQQTFDGLVQKYGDKAGHKIDVTAEDKSKTLDKAKKALEKAQTDYDDAPIGKEEKAEAALQKAQEEYNTALAEKQEWDEVKSVKDRFVAEQIAAKQAAEEERHTQAVAEEEARRAEEERKAREREATGANNVATNIREKWEGAPRVEGNADEITLANGERIAGHYVLVESGAASASHDALNGFAKTEGFPLDENEQSVNDRDYERDKNAQQITRQIANEYDSRALQDPVVVSQDGVVLSGNGRTMAGEIAAAQDTDGAYIDYLKKYAPKYGFTPEQVEGMAHPRVVFVPDASMPYTAETFAKFNQQEMKGQSKTEQAVKLGKLVDDATFGRIIRSINRFDTLGDFYADTKATAEAIGELLKAGAINQMQHTEMFDGDAISAQGREILENMLIGKAFESNPDAVRQLAAYKSLRQSVITALAEISNNIALGEYSLESELSDAIALAYNARKNGYKAGDAVSEFARQGKLFETEEDATAADYTNATVLMLADVMNDNRVTRLKKVLSIYNQQAEQSAAGQTDLFADGVKTKQEILDEVLVLLQHGTESEQQQALDAAREQRKAAAEQGTGVQENGDTGESDTAERGTEQSAGADVGGRQTDLGGSQPRQSGGENTEEVDENGRPFVKAADGSTVFGEIRESSGLQPAPIKLSEGYQDQDGKGYGLVHIEANHGEQIRNEGFETVEDFVSYVAQNYDEDNIRVGKRRENGNTTFLIQVTDEHDNTLFIELSQDGSYWNVNSAGVFRKGYSNKKETVAKTEPQQPNNTVSTDSSLSESEESGISPSEPNGESTVSDGKNTENSETNNKKASFSFNPNTALGKTAIVYIQKWLDAFKSANGKKKGYKRLFDTLKKIAEANGRQDFFVVFNDNGEMLGVGANAAEAYGIALNHDEESFNVVRQTSTDNGTIIGFTNGWLFTDDIPESEWRDDSGRLKQEVKDASIARLAKELEIKGEEAALATQQTEQPKPTDEAVAAANEEVDTNPTEAQKEAGNYKKGHVTIDGFDISIENPSGSTRSGTDAQGNPWSVTMHNSYGYIRMTEGVDGDHIDIFLSDHIDDWNGTVYVVDQVNEDGSFDEHKVMYGFNSAEEAREAYLSNYSEGWQGLGTITGVSREEFKKWVDSSHRKTKAFADYKSVQTTEGQNEAAMKSRTEGTEQVNNTTDGTERTDNQGEGTAVEENSGNQGETSQDGTAAEQPKESREELDRRLMEERRQRILAEGTSFDKPFGLVPVSETMTVEDIDTNMQRIAEGLKANEGNKDFGEFYGFAYQGNFKENLGQQLKGYYQSLTGVVDPKTLMAWAGSHGFKTYDDVVEYGKGLYDKTDKTDRTRRTEKAEKTDKTETEPNKQARTPGKAGSLKIDDVGEKIAGARKDMRREIAKGIGEATVQSLIELPFSKAFKKPNLKKAVESGALREEDAFFFDAWLASTVNQTKPKVTQQEVRRKRYNPNAETNLERWAKQTFEALDFLKTFVEADETERDRIIGNLTAEVFPKREAQLAEFERIRELNKGRNDNITFGDCLTPNPVWVTYQVMQRLGYAVGDKLDIPFGILRGNTTGTSYYLYNTKDEHSTYIYPNSLEEGIDAIVWLARIKRGDTDIQHPVSAFYTTPTKSEMGDSGRFRVIWGGWSSMKNQEFDSKEAAEAFAAKKKDAYVNPIQEVKRRFGYKIMFRNPLTGERTAVSDMEFDTKAEAEAYMDGNYEAMNDGANEMLAKESGTKKEVTADDVVGVTVTYGKDGWQYAAVINAPYANNMGMPLVLQEFKTRGEAKAYADSVKDKVFETYKQYKAKQKEFVYFSQGEDTRIGEDYRGGKDVTAEDFMNTFGFRGVQFGNWTNQADRQMAVNQAYDAFMDLAKLLGMSPRAMSLNGELGIAFGARGSGNANAHYEYDEVVINLTKTRGAGSLAHEWWHALDNYFARRGGMGRGMVTDVKSIAMRDELRKAYDRLIDEIEKSNYYKRSVKKGDYWGRMHEVTARLLAEWVNRELKQKGELNTFLARGVDTEKFVKMNYELYKMLMDNAGREAMPFEEYKELDEALSGMPYPSDKEIDAFSDALRNIFETIEEREGENGAVELFSIGDGTDEANGTDAQQVAYNAVREALANAGIEVVEATEEDVKRLKDSRKQLKDSKGTIRGWVGNDGKIHLTKDGLNAETPIHEYTHLWAEALQMNNPELWEQIKGLLKDTPEWKRITSMKEYSNLKDDDRIAGEVLAHISGKKNAERMEAEAKRMIDEAPTLEEAAKAANLLGRMRDALKKFWTWVGKTLLGKKGNINIDQVSNMVLADLANGVDPFNPRGGKRTNRTKRTDASIESEQNGPNDIERVNQKFNDELQQQMEGTLPSGHVYDMGMPSAYLRSTGIPNLPIRLQSSILNKKSDDPLHPYKLEEVKDLVKLIQKPLAIFAYGDKTKAQNLMIGISQPTAEGKQFLVGLALNPDVKGKTLEINSVRNVFPKNYHDWIHWIIQGKMLRVDDRESIKAIIDALRINPVDYISDNDLDSAANIVENFENPQVEGENFSDVDLSIVGPDNQIAEEYNRMTGYNSDDVSGYVRGKEELLRSFFDGLRPLEQMQQLVEKALGRKLRDSENAYGLATLLHSVNKAMMDKAETEFMLPVLRQSANMMRRLIGRRGHRKMSREEAREMLNNYLLAKHGLERNEWFYQQALANDPDAEEEDKAGLRGLAESLGENPDDYKAVAEQVVADFEDMFDATEIGDYWASMKALTDRMLEISYESGMIDKDTFESLKARHKYYVPLRGFADGTSGDLFDYVSRHPHFQSVFKKMKGRKSKADDPLANLYNMLQSAIVIGNNNKVMQNIYNMAVNAKSDLLRVNRSWYVYNDATDEWEERFPDIPEDATADEIDAIMKQFDADMQQLKQQGKAKQLLNKMELQKKVLPYQAKEHEMTAYVNGRKVVMHVAGNPLVAQQLNKANTQQLGAFAEIIQGATRFASMINTSLSPAFMFTNAARDIGFSLYSATVTGGLKKNLQMVGNLFRAGWVLPRLILTGKMGGGITKMFSPTEAAKIEQWWNEFVDNGGETGFTNTLSAEKAKGQVDDMIRRMINYRSKDGQSRLKKATLGVIETMGRYSEDISRFAAYCLKRAEGETVKASVNEAKNVTVNFNVKGGGNSLVARFVAGCRSCYSFFNAALQGINRMGRLAKENPKAFAACLLACVVQGAMLPWLNMALFAMLGGDDDDWEKYEMLSEYTANHNLIIFVGNHKFLKIPYSQELAPFAAMGNIWFRQQMGWNHGRSIASQIGNMFLDLAPVNIGESKTTMGKLAKTATPTILMPVTEWLLNENFTAAPIEKRYEWNKFDSGWEKAYESRTSKWLIDATRYLDEKTNGAIDINPSFVEHIATGMLGGIGRSGDNLMKYVSEGFQMQNAPYLRTIMFDSKQQGYIGAVSREYGRLAYEVLPEVKHDVDRADMLEFARLANTQDYQIANVVSIYKTGKDLLGNKTSFQGIDKLEKEFKKAEKAAMESPDNRTEQVDEYLEAMRAQINEMKMEMLDAIDEVIYNNSGAGRRSRIDRVREIERDSKEKYQREHSEE